MTDQNPILTFLSTKTGISGAIIAFALPLVVGFVTEAIVKKKAYNNGWDDAQAAFIDGTAEINGKIVSIITDAEKQAIKDNARIQGETQGFQEAQFQFTETLRGIHARHSQTILILSNRDHSPEEIAWRNVELPDDVRLRLSSIIATREDSDSKSRLSESRDRTELVGDKPTIYNWPSPDERIP